MLSNVRFSLIKKTTCLMRRRARAIVAGLEPALGEGETTSPGSSSLGTLPEGDAVGELFLSKKHAVRAIVNTTRATSR